MANVLSSIQVITGTTGTGASSDHSFSGGTQLDKMFFFISYDFNVADNLHDQTFRRAELTSTSNLRLTAGQASGNQNINFHAIIVIFTTGSDLVVNRYTSDTVVATRNVTITAVSATAQAFILPHGERDPSDTSWGSEELFAYGLTSTTNVQIQVDAANNTVGGNTIGFEVVDWNNSDITVQHVNFQVMTSIQTVDTASITSVDLARTWVIGTARTDSGAFTEFTDEMVARMDFETAAVVRVQRGSGGAQMHWSAQIIEDTAGTVWTTQMGGIALGTGDLTGTFTLTAVDVARTFVNGTMVTSFADCGQSNDTSSGNQDTANCTVALTDSTTITATRGVTDTTTLDMVVQSVDFDGAFPVGRNRFHIIG